MKKGEFYKCDSFSNTGASIVGEYLGDEKYCYSVKNGGYLNCPIFKVIMSNHSGYPSGRIIRSIRKDNWIKL